MIIWSFLSCYVYPILRSEDSVKSAKFKQPGELSTKPGGRRSSSAKLKICLLEAQISQLPPGTITTGHEVPKVRAFVIFATLIYSPWWMTCASATDATWHDLNLFHIKLLMYEVVNPAISSSAIKALKRHLWYLTGEMVSLALFSDKVPTDERGAFANQLLTFKTAVAIVAPRKQCGSSYGKPAEFPNNITSATSLADLVNEDSWFTLHILQVDIDFLIEDVNDWSKSSAYQESLADIEALNVINDYAERRVKLSADFLCVARDEQHYQNVLQVVEQDLKNMPNLRKRK